MVKTEFCDIETEKLMELLDNEYNKLCKVCRNSISDIVEMELELEQRSNI